LAGGAAIPGDKTNFKPQNQQTFGYDSASTTKCFYSELAVKLGIFINHQILNSKNILKE
jgi:hypothetical protein